MPADNNITERGNRADKDDLKHKKCYPLKFIELTVMKLSNESSMQLDYHGRMKQSIHSSKFMEAVFMTLEGNRNVSSNTLKKFLRKMKYQSDLPRQW